MTTLRRSSRQTKAHAKATCSLPCCSQPNSKKEQAKEPKKVTVSKRSNKKYVYPTEPFSLAPLGGEDRLQVLYPVDLSCNSVPIRSVEQDVDSVMDYILYWVEAMVK